MDRRSDRVSPAAWSAWAASRERADRRRRRRIRALVVAGTVTLAVGSLTAAGILAAGGGATAGASATTAPESAGPTAAPPTGGTAPADARPVVWVQAGHATPREPGYEDGTGAAGGPFETEAGFTLPVARRIVRQLRACGGDARMTPGRVTPLAAPGAVFVSIHHDAPGGRAAIVWATCPDERIARRPGRRPPTQVGDAVEARSRDLALSVHRRYAAVHGPDNGADGDLASPAGRAAPRDLREYHGFFRTDAGARVVIEAGAAGADDEFPARTGLVASAIAAGIYDHLRSRGLLGRTARRS